jgi:hypothetical protein
MTRDEAVSFIQYELGNRSDLTEEIITRLQSAQRLIEQGRTLPYFLMQEDASLALASGSADISFPTGFLREVQDETFHFTSDDDEAVYLEKMVLQEGEQRFVDEDAGQPIAYAIRKTAWRFWPSRDTAYTLTYSYYKSATSLVTNASDNAWLVYAPEILIGKAGAAIAHVIGHERAAIRLGGMEAEGWRGAMAETIMREEENDPSSLGARL